LIEINGRTIFTLTAFMFFVMVSVMYIAAAILTSYRSRLRNWPISRYTFWIFGVLCSGTAIIAPMVMRTRMNFTTHMIGHLLLGMLGPLLIVLSAPVTLFLRTLNVNLARFCSRILKSWPVHLMSHPVTASFLDMGGLWVLYTTGFYAAMQENLFLHILVDFHVFFAGYLFSASMIYIDPTPHQTSFLYRAVVLVAALSGHAILSKYIYIHPPENVPVTEAETGGMLMYYGGDIIDMILIGVLCYQWYKNTRPRGLAVDQ